MNPILVFLSACGAFAIFNPLVVLGVVAVYWTDLILRRPPSADNFFDSAAGCGILCGVFSFALSAIYCFMLNQANSNYQPEHITEGMLWVVWSPIAGGAAGYAWMLVLRRYTRIKPWMGVLFLFVALAMQFQWAITLEKLL